jgi:hypothetical protein
MAHVRKPLAAVGLWLVASTAVEIGRSSEELFWPADARCPHDDGAEAHPA